MSGLFGFCLSCIPVEEPAPPAETTSTPAGSALTTALAPFQARVAALQSAGSVTSRIQGAMSAAPIGTRFKNWGIGGTSLDASWYHKVGPTGVPYRDAAPGTNAGFLGHF